MVSRTRLLGTVAIAGMFITAPVHAVQLHEAAEEGDVEQVSQLIAQGADVNAKSDDGWTPLSLASRNGHIEIVRKLLSSRADVKAKNTNMATPLMFASLPGHIEIVRLLLSSGANVNAELSDGTTALIVAAGRGHGEIVKLLLSGGADVEAKQDAGLTALMAATARGHIEMVRLLLSSGADVNAELSSGRRALQIAKNAGHQDIVAVLLSNNADTTETPRMKCSVLKGRLLAGSARGAVLLYEDKLGYFAGRDDEGRFLIVSEFFLAGERWSKPLVANSATEIVDAAGNATQLPSGGANVCIPIRFWARGERLERVVLRN